MKDLPVLQVRSLRLSGEGRPAIIVPLLGAELDTLLGEVHAARAQDPDLLEWRVDRFADRAPEALVAAATRLRATAGPLPLLLTARTVEQGGDAVDPALLLPVLAQGDLVDIELLDPRSGPLVEAARAAQVPIVGSHHDLTGTPDVERLVQLLTRLAGAGADLVKLAVTPRDPGDVAALLTATWRASTELAVPVLTMAMGPLGAVSRLAGGVFGSVATFAVVGGLSAPGQLPVAQVRRVLDVLHPATGPRAVLCGPMGAGKTAVGRELARRWRVKLRDTDSEVTRVAGRSIAAVFADQGEAAFRELEAAAVAQALIEHDGVLALGGGAVLHADTRAALDRYVARGGRVVLLDVSAGAVAARLSRDGARPLLGDDPMARWQELADQRRAIYQAVATHVVTTDDRTPAQVAREVQRVLEAR